MTFAALVPVLMKYSEYLPQLFAGIDILIKRIDRMKEEGLTEEEIKRRVDIFIGNVWEYPQE